MSQKKYSLLYPDTNAQYRTLSDVTMHDLGMDQICKKLSAKEREQNYIQNVMTRMYADPAVTQYRCDIFEDVLQQKKMRDDLMEILERISFLREYGSFNREYDESDFYDHIASKDRINEDTIWKKNFKFQPFDVNADAVISTPMQKVMDTAVMRSESRGGIVKLPEGDQAKDVTRYTDRIVNHMISHMVKRVREVLNKYVSITITDMTDLIPELLYYIKWAEYIQKLQEQGFTFAKASVYKEGENESDPYMMQARGIYNLKLAVFETEESGNIVPNDMDFDRNRRVYILTGANRGGKTTITQAVGQLFVLAQGGIYIPGKAFTFSPVTGIYTHFPADEDKTLDLGRLGEECKRFKAIYEEADSRSLLLMNESFSTTSFEEGYYIAKDSVRAILHKGMRTIYNTHMHKLAFDVEEMNEEQQKAEHADGKAFSMIVHMKGTERSYQIEVAPPEGKSYASEIAQKYGVTYEMLVK